MKRSVSLLLALLMVCGLLLTGCNSASPAISPSPSVAPSAAPSPDASAAPSPDDSSAAGPDFSTALTLNVVMPGAESDPETQLAANEWKTAIQQDLNCTINWIYIDWNDYFTKLNAMLAAGQDVDLFWLNTPTYPSYLANGYCLPINDYLQQYGPDLLNLIPQAQWNLLTSDGNVMAIPVQTDPADQSASLVIRKDILQEVGMSSINTLDDLTNYLTLGKAAHPDMDGIGNPIFQELSKGVFSSKNITQLQTGIGGAAVAQLAFIDENDPANTVYSLYESDEFKQYCNYANSLYKAGLVGDWALTNPVDETTYFNNGQLLAYRGTGGMGAGLNTALVQATSGDSNVILKEYQINPNNYPRYYQTGSSGLFIVPTQAKNPARAVAFVNWMCKDQQNYDLMVYGVEGRDYTLTDTGKITRNITDDLIPFWMIMMTQYARVDTSVPDDVANDMAHWNDGAQVSKSFGFTFDQTPVATQMATLTAAVGEYMNPIFYGVKDYDSNYPAALAQLKAAGLDTVMAEIQKQYAAFIAAQG